MKEDRLVPRLRGKENRATVELWAWRGIKHRRGRGFMLVHHCSSCGARTYHFEHRSRCIITGERAGQLPEAPHDDQASRSLVIPILTLPVSRAFLRVKFGGWHNGLILADGTPAIRCLMCQWNASEC